MTGMNAACSQVFMDDPNIQMIWEIQAASLLDGDNPRLIDEWQVQPQIWNMVRRRVDAIQQPGQFILTGSAVPASDESRHSGAGRFVHLRLYTMSWFEKGFCSPGVSLESLFAGQTPQSI